MLYVIFSLHITQADSWAQLSDVPAWSHSFHCSCGNNPGVTERTIFSILFTLLKLCLTNTQVRTTCNEEVQKVNFRGQGECIGQFIRSFGLAACVCWGTRMGHVLCVLQTCTWSCAQPEGPPTCKQVVVEKKCWVGSPASWARFISIYIYIQNYKQVI